MIKEMVKNAAENFLFYRDAERTFFEPQEFPWVPAVEAEWKTIRKELDELMLRRDEIPNFQDYSPIQRRITQDDRWKTFFLYQFGHVEKENCARCPETVRILKKIPGMNTAMFSILAPGKYIPPHRGAYKGVLRYHLGLLVPKPEHSCRIRVGNDIRHWQEGKSLIFDDSHEHEVWNDADSYRVVLFVNFRRPTAFPLSLANRLLIWIRCQRKKVT
ncbi:MAG: aspartyl/asparaginyl beta-hydroxylase domain-containing protein [Acidobacteria bacterium]|nr:MAG: aspartyl/asparaginyl beta-hydroxylase domain-containing protein [Acidobacteriota bacterium]